MSRSILAELDLCMFADRLEHLLPIEAVEIALQIPAHKRSITRRNPDLEKNKHVRKNDTDQQNS